MVDLEPSVDFRQRREKQRTDGETEHVDGNGEVAHLEIRGLEVGEELRDGGGGDGRCQGSEEVIAVRQYGRMRDAGRRSRVDGRDGRHDRDHGHVQPFSRLAPVARVVRVVFAVPANNRGGIGQDLFFRDVSSRALVTGTYAGTKAKTYEAENWESDLVLG